MRLSEGHRYKGYYQSDKEVIFSCPITFYLKGVSIDWKHKLL